MVSTERGVVNSAVFARLFEEYENMKIVGEGTDLMRDSVNYNYIKMIREAVFYILQEENKDIFEALVELHDLCEKENMFKWFKLKLRPFHQEIIDQFYKYFFLIIF